VAATRILILGVGNVLLGDEGVGVHVARQLEALDWPSSVSVVDGGTGGFHLLSHIAECDVAILVDATMDGQPPGTIRAFEPRYASDYPPSLSAHDIGLKDLIQSAELLGQLPRVVLVTISVDAIQPMQTELSPTIAAVVPEVIEQVKRLVPGH
jgi:hydrogenase maturation protease